MAARNKRNAAADNDAFLGRGLGGIQRIFDAHLDLFHRRFSRRANFHHSNATGKFCQSLLQFLAIVVRSCFFDLLANRCHAALDRFAIAAAFDDGRGFFVDNHTLCRSEIRQL